MTGMTDYTAPMPEPETPDEETPKRSLSPVRKVAVGGAAGAAATVIVWGLSFAGIEMPPEVAAAVAVLITFGTSYLTPPKE